MYTRLTSTRTCSAAVEQLLRLACARNVPAELHYEHTDGTVITARVRLLEVTDDRILADQPRYSAEQRRIPKGRQVTVHFSLKGTRYQFTSTMERAALLVRLNDRRHIPGIALGKPQVVTESQRRANLRVLLASYDPIHVDLARPHPEVPCACSLEERPISGWIVDLSVGGVAVLIDEPTLCAAQCGEHFYLTFTLPTTGREFPMLGVVRQTRVIQTSGALRVAFAFYPWAGSHFRSDQAALAKFVAKHERRLLRRRK